MTETPDPGAPVEIAQYDTELSAQFAQTRLREEGIESRVVGGATAGFRAEAPGRVHLLVHRKDADRAREILSEDDA